MCKIFSDNIAYFEANPEAHNMTEVWSQLKNGVIMSHII